MQGMGTGVGGVMRVLCREIYMNGHSCAMLTACKHGDSRQSVARTANRRSAGSMWNWRACYLFLLVLCAGVTSVWPAGCRKRVRSMHRARACYQL